MPKLETGADPYACIEGADAIVTEWDRCRALDLDRVKRALSEP
jgi:UDPglucose 6-dehydrogenase